MHDRVQHAKSYPFPAPPRSYLFDNGRVRDLNHLEVDLKGRVPVLAAGSNQSPEQIGRKYAGEGDRNVVIPAQRGRLRHFDVVYAAHLSSYGSVPATFQSSPETDVIVFVLWLDEPQLQRMHATEGNYTYDRLTGIELELDDGAGTITEAYAYSSKIGCLNHAGACLSLAEIAASNRRYPEVTQPEVLGIVRNRISPRSELDEFIAEHVTDASVRTARSHTIGSDALPLAFEREVIERL